MNIYQHLSQATKTGQPVALCTIVQARGSTPRHVGSKMLVFPDGHILGSVGGGQMENRVIAAAQQALQTGKTQLLAYTMVDPQRGDPGVCGGQLEVFVEPLLPKPVVVVVGAGHVGKALAHLAKFAGFRVVVSDDRPEFCNPQQVPDGDEYLPVALVELPQHLEITPQTYLVLTTRGVPIDVPGLPALLDSPAGYIGVIGSRRRWLTTRKLLLENGLPEEKLTRVVSPIGLEIGAETPEEIAVSVMAEIIRLRNQRGD